MTSEYMIPPAPNWYASSALRGSSNYVAYASQNQIVILEALAVEESVVDKDNWRANPEADQLNPPKTYIITDAHEERTKICSVAWCPDPDQSGNNANLVSAADDGTVRLWSWSPENHSLKSQHNIHSENKSRVFGLDWSKADTTLVVSADDAGVFAVWDTVSNRLTRLYYGKFSVLSLALHPQDPDIMAFGCKMGLVVMVTLSAPGRIIHKMRGHDEDCYSVSWCPQVEDDWKLVSSSRDKTLRIWSYKEGKQLRKIKIPSNRGRGAPAPNFLTCLWYDGDRILTGGDNGELFLCHLDSPDNKEGAKFDVLHREHFRSIFSLCVVNGIVYSNGQDRIVSLYSLNSNRSLYNMPTLNGFAYCLATNMLDPSIVALGVGDGLIRIWKTGSSQLFDIKHIRVNQAKVMCLAWHPEREGLIGFGTDEGRVGWIDVLSQKSQITFSSFQHRGGVYCISWAQDITSADSSSKDNGQFLYTVGDGKYVQHNVKSEKHVIITDMEQFTSTKKMSISQAIWKTVSDKVYLIFGYEDGTVEFRSVPDLVVVLTLKSFAKLIQYLAFHPDFLNDGSEAKYKNWMAVCSNELQIHVWDLNGALEQESRSGVDKNSLILVTPTVKLEGHFQRVLELSWSHFQNGRLLSISYDSSAQVWDLETATPLHNFQGHSKRLMCCMWHPTDPDLAISGGEDYYLALWRPSKQTTTKPVKRVRKYKQHVAPKIEKAEKPVAELDYDELLKKHRQEQTKSSPDTEPQSSEYNTSEQSKESNREIIFAKKKKKAGTKTFFPSFSKKESQCVNRAGEDSIWIYDNFGIKNLEAEGSEGPEAAGLKGVDQLSQKLDKLTVSKKPYGNSKGKQDVEDHLKIFGDDIKLDELLDKECEAVETTEARAAIYQWRGNLAEMLKLAESQGCLTDALLAQAAGVSQALWRYYAAAYAQQLVKEGNYIRASEMFTAVHMIYEAIEVLQKNNFCLPALVLAKSRLPPDDPIIRDVFRSLGYQATQAGNLSLAAKAYAAAGDRGKAAARLAKLDTKDSLMSAAFLALDAKDCDMYAQLCFTRCVLESDYETGMKLTTSKPGMAWGTCLLIVMVEVEQILIKQDKTNAPLMKIIQKKFTEKGIEVNTTFNQSIDNFLKSTTVPDEQKLRFIRLSCTLCQATVHLDSDPQASLGSVAASLADLHARHKELEIICKSLLPRGSQPVEAGEDVIGKSLDFQCSWPELRSIQCSEALSILHSDESKWTENLMQDVADAIMLEDIMFVQKLKEEIAEGEAALTQYKIDNKQGLKLTNGKMTNGDGTNHEVVENGDVDLTPSLRGTQTLSLGDGGKWVSSSDSYDKNQMPVPPGGLENLPPPPKPTASFYTRFLEGQEDSLEAEKELQKLRWILSKHCITVPYPDLTRSCKTLLNIVLKHKLGCIPAEEEEEGKKMSFSKRLARFCYYKGSRKHSTFFLKHS